MNTFRLSYNPIEVCRAVVSDKLNGLNISYTFNEIGEVVLQKKLSSEQQQKVNEILEKYGITLFKREKTNIVQTIRQAVEEMIFSKDIRTEKVSAYLSEKLGYSYAYLSNQFSEETHTSIENFIILRKIEYAKQLLLKGGMSLTEIAHRLDYSSVAHLSGQFKKMTGLTPTTFIRIIEKRRNNNPEPQYE